jgi:putative Mg2+ transporter-C (MgtC) family protein
MDLLPMIIKFIIVFVMAFFFGMDRQRAHKSAGFSTFIFVSIGACALAITATTIEPQNPLPLLTAIVTGIGFLGAGALIKTSDKVYGFSTAASIWAFAIIGLIIGVGQFLIGVIIYALIWLVILIDRYLEKRGIGLYQKKVTIKTTNTVTEKDIRTLFLVHTKKYQLLLSEADKKNHTLTLTYLIEGSKEELNKVAQMLYEKPWFESCKIE